MAQTLPGHSFIIKQSSTFLRPFFFGTTGQAVNAGGNSSMVVAISKNGGAFATATNGTAGNANLLEIANGWYSIALATADVGLTGILAYHVTATTGGPADFADFVQTAPTFLNDLAVTQVGPTYVANISSNLKQNQPFGALFFMTQLGSSNPAPGLTVTGQRTFTNAGFSNVSGTILEVGGVGNGAGWYYFAGMAADSNAPQAGFKMTAVGANDSDFTLWFQP
jgi:hypothetical protein